jgi:membrane-associated phospholipid phosphatase
VREGGTTRHRTVRTVTAFAAVLALAAPARALTPGAAVDQLKRDATSLITVDQPPTAAQLALGLGLVALVGASDAHLVDQGRAHLPGWVDDFKTGGATGSANTIAVSLLAGGLLAGDHRATTGGLTLVEGNVVLGVVLQLAKGAFGRVRPNHPGPGRWFAGGDSFPSDHTAHAFLVASVLDATIDRPAWRWVLYPLASCVALDRIHEGVHYPTDVIAGGLLGWWIGHRLAVAHDLARPHRVAVSWAPLPGGAWVVARASF